MKQKLYVMMGDVISSRRIKDKEEFQIKLEKACADVNRAYAGDIYADFKILKGIDEIEGILSNMENSYEIINTILEQIYPQSMRFALVLDYIDTAAETRDVSKMDGPAFHKASDIISDLKRSKLMFSMSIEDDMLDRTAAGVINLILLLKKKWSLKQHRIFRKYQEAGTQHEVARSLGITQQAVSRTLNRSMWKEISGIEENLRYVLRNYSQRLSEGGMMI